MKAYGSRELIALLTNLGYKPMPQTGSSHLKYACPKKIAKGQRSFIIVVQNRNNYDPVIQKGYITQIRRHGFTKDEIDTSW